MKLYLKRLVCWLGFGDWLIEFCEHCGMKQPVFWHVEDQIWEDITGKKGGVCCPKCFDKLGRKKGYTFEWIPRKENP